jgi:hypothetical protein
LQRVEIGSRLISPRFGFAHPVVPDEAFKQLPAELGPDAPGGSMGVKIRAARTQVQAVQLAKDAAQLAV